MHTIQELITQLQNLKYNQTLNNILKHRLYDIDGIINELETLDLVIHSGNDQVDLVGEKTDNLREMIRSIIRKEEKRHYWLLDDASLSRWLNDLNMNLSETIYHISLHLTEIKPLNNVEDNEPIDPLTLEKISPGDKVIAGGYVFTLSVFMDWQIARAQQSLEYFHLFVDPLIGGLPFSSIYEQSYLLEMMLEAGRSCPRIQANPFLISMHTMVAFKHHLRKTIKLSSNFEEQNGNRMELISHWDTAYNLAINVDNIMLDWSKHSIFRSATIDFVSMAISLFIINILPKEHAERIKSIVSYPNYYKPLLQGILAIGIAGLAHRLYYDFEFRLHLLSTLFLITISNSTEKHSFIFYLLVPVLLSILNALARYHQASCQAVQMVDLSIRGQNNVRLSDVQRPTSHGFFHSCNSLQHKTLSFFTNSTCLNNRNEPEFVDMEMRSLTCV